MYLQVTLIFLINLSLACRRPVPDSPSPPGDTEAPDDPDTVTEPLPEVNVSGWGDWISPYENSTWKEWVNKYNQQFGDNSSQYASNFTEDWGDVASGSWPEHWKGLGKPNVGVPPPPWAHVPLGYGKPLYCFLRPVKGNCQELSVRWGFNPTKNECQQFVYSGCGGNQNNFVDKEDCTRACVETPSTDCEAQEKVNFEEMLFD